MPLAAVGVASACGQPNEAVRTPPEPPATTATTEARCERAESALAAFDPRHPTPEEAANGSLRPGFIAGREVESPVGGRRYEVLAEGRVVGHVDVRQEGGLWGATAGVTCG